MAELARDELEETRSMPGTKITDLIDNWAATHDTPFVSFEYYAPRTPAGQQNLLKRLQRMAQREPLFMDVTWGAGGSTSELTMDLCLSIRNDCHQEPNMHLTCTNMDEAMVDHALETAWKNGIVNILALRGDPPAGGQQWEATRGGYNCARDLVKHIRARYGNQFCITVAGYPQGHPDRIKRVERALTADEATRATHTPQCVFVCSDEEYAIELSYLKSKVDAGADVITTQMFFEASLFLKFVSDCRAIGITVPIIPGIMLLQTYSGFKRMIDMCKSHVPHSYLQRLELVKDDEQAVVELGIELGTQLCKDLMAAGVVGLHIYTLNLDHVTHEILKNIGLYRN